MKTKQKFLGKVTIGVAAAFLLAGTTTAGAQGFVPLGSTGPEAGAGGRGIQIRGNVVCIGCSLAEAREAHPNKQGNHLYWLAHRQGQMVIEVNRVGNTLWWNHLTVPRIWVRGEESLCQKLTAKENLFKELEVSGVLSPAQVLDLSEVTIRK
ncbi:MAG: hypothetical protein HYZ72_07775 [Deltaproteobacteria bacterium]|nr:hypothetical protein [Deltaproteobacteria bacterium]